MLHHWPPPPTLPSVSDICTPTAEPALPASSATKPDLTPTPPRSPPSVDLSRLELDLTDPRTRLGVGSHGTVHVARYHGELVAVKHVPLPRLSPAVAADKYVRARRARSLARFADDVRRYEAVSHPAIVPFLGVATLPDASAALLLSALMPGGSLADSLEKLRRARAPLSISALVTVALQACGGLRALHVLGCVWGDAKPGNVLLSDPVDPVAASFPSATVARISDFGLSRIVELNLLDDTTVEASGQPLGTYNYMAPEAFMGLDPAENPVVAKAADVYSFGLVLYEMLTLRTPWKRLQFILVCDRVSNGARPAWPVDGDDDYYRPIPTPLRELVEACWAHEPTSRPTADEVFESLETFSHTLVKPNSDQRPVRDIGGGSVVQTAVAQFAGMHPSIMHRVPSKQSIASTAVPVGEGSVSIDLQSSGVNSSMLNSSIGGLTSTQESARAGNLSDDDHIHVDSRTEFPAHFNSGAKVSPVTSPEPRSLNIPSDRILYGQQVLGSGKTRATTIPRAVDVVNLTEASSRIMMSSGSSKAINPVGTKFPVDANQASMEQMNGNRSQGPASELVSPHAAEENFAVDEEGRFKALQDPQDADPNKHRYDTDLLAAAAQLTEVEATAATMSSLHGGTALEGSFLDLTSSNASNASAKRKRTKRRVLTIIEQATAALREAQRQTELANKIPPKQRKEAADKRAIEDANHDAEQIALLAIETADKGQDFSTVLDIMNQHRDSLDIAKAGTVVLEKYCKAEMSYFDVCEEGGVEEMLSGVVRFGADDASICTCFCNCVTSLEEFYDDKVGHLLRAIGVPSTIVDILGYHRAAVPVQTAGCKALASMARADELSRSAVATLGGPAAVYKALTQNNASFHDVELAKAALKAVRHIAQDNELAAQFLVDVAALDAVSRTADVFPDSTLETDILHTLRAFAFYNGGRRNIIMSSGLKALTQIMLRNRDSDFLVQCCTFVREIARWRDVECEDAMLQSCIAERVTSLMQESNDMRGEEGARVAWYACQACTFLASFGSRSRQRLRIVGAIDRAIAILKHRKENYRVVKSATDALAELTKGETEAKRYAESSGALPALNAALDLHRSNMRVRNALQWTIDCLSSTQGMNLGPAQGSQVYQELVKNGSLAEGQDAAKKGKRFLGFKFLQRSRV